MYEGIMTLSHVKRHVFASIVGKDLMYEGIMTDIMLLLLLFDVV